MACDSALFLKMIVDHGLETLKKNVYDKFICLQSPVKRWTRMLERCLLANFYDGVPLILLSRALPRIYFTLKKQTIQIEMQAGNYGKN
jgi:hypothetical protein